MDNGTYLKMVAFGVVPPENMMQDLSVAEQKQLVRGAYNMLHSVANCCN